MTFKNSRLAYYLNHGKDGYLLDGNKCKPDESDECALAPPRYPCDENAICTNLDVGYSCECKKGEGQDEILLDDKSKFASIWSDLDLTNQCPLFLNDFPKLA